MKPDPYIKEELVFNTMVNYCTQNLTSDKMVRSVIFEDLNLIIIILHDIIFILL